MRFSWRPGFICFFALATWVHLVSAVPAEKDTSFSTTSAPSSTSEAESTTTVRDAQETHATSRRPGADDTDDATQTALSDRRSTSESATKSSPHSIVIPPTAHRSHPHPSWSPTPGAPFTHHFPPPPAPTSPPHSAPAQSQSGQPPIAIAFEVLGGVIALGILVGLARCYIVWRRTPPRDRIAALVHRHQLEREMEEQERERIARLSRALEARRWRPPPPPYQPAPDYEAVVRSDSPE
ncbi:hypothetical protein BV20DRAFT_19295 [Pilatotrama ljubarskyi]|nr:hypothetical protein BV20DRAFT_19295 [Pilatotrama ljubarskyi]